MSLQAQILQFLLSGITVGSIYALIALGFVTIYNVTGIINFAQGEFAVYGAFLAISVFQETRLVSGNVQLALDWPLPLAALFGMAITTLIGMLLYRAGIQPARKASVLSMIIITIGAAFVLRGTALLIWGTDPYRLPVFTEGSPLKLFGAILTRQSVWVIAVTGILLAILYWFFNHTLMGKTLRACADNPNAARLMGISPRKMALLAFAISAATSAIAGIVIVPSTFMTYDRGLTLSLKGFVAAIVGGLSNPAGAVLGGVSLGILESFGAGYLSSGYKDAISFIVLFVVLAVRLGGLMRRRAAVVEQAGL
ncbi:MAG TPA: branched-chain amino acid ABC transporter permease [Anaerolineales bacterium]|nr:branched-chain amino acid ABC transporter permease [Anaerolineales bacterium]